MRFDFRKNNLVCLFPWLTDVTAIKCTGQICNSIGFKYNLNTYIVTYRNECYPRYGKYCPSVSLKFLKGRLKYGGWKVFFDTIWFILCNAGRIEILYLYHMPNDYVIMPLAGYLYKMLNKNGVLYVRFEADISTLPLSYPNCINSDSSGHLKTLIKNFLIRRFYLNTDIFGVIDNCTFDNSRKRALWKYTKDRIKIQLNGYRLYEEPYVKDFKEKYKIILLSGRLNTYQKGFDVFLNALKSVDLVDWRVEIAGALSQEQVNQVHEIEMQYPRLSGKVSLLGYIDDVHLYSKKMNDALIFCLPSRFDGIPLVIPDAMARGCVVIGSDLYGIKEIATDNGKCGFFFQNGNSKELALKLNEIIQGTYNLEEFSKKSIERATKIFHWDTIVDNLNFERFIKH